ncbi:MAG: hypothetical protein QHH24_03355 [Candidatus Bathyarchaeota archaeon]|nr:hypothetical protein [Candidatus Bathyarchaeota archaeon]
MPATSIDTFFACSLMVLLTVVAMASTTKVIYSYIGNRQEKSEVERFYALSKRLLLDCGTPADWGKYGEEIPERFGLAESGAETTYVLDIDKVSRLSDRNHFRVTYAQAYSALGMPDLSFKMEIKPVFDVTVNLTAKYEGINETTYTFRILTERDGAPVSAELKCYVVSEKHVQQREANASSGQIHVNMSIPNSDAGPALFAVLTRSPYDLRIASFNTYSFQHGSATPKPGGTYAKLSPLNHSLTVSLNHPLTNVSQVYALTFNCISTLARTEVSNQSAVYRIPSFTEPSPIMLVAAGYNFTDFFTEWMAYPQVPVQFGVSPAGRSNTVTCHYIVEINSVIYKCTIWIGGLTDEK